MTDKFDWVDRLRMAFLAVTIALFAVVGSACAVLVWKQALAR